MKKPIVVSHALHNVAKAYVNEVNDITTFFETTTPTNIITNKTILNQYSIKQVLKVFGKKGEAAVQNNFSSFMTSELLIQRSVNTSAMNNEERAWHTY